MIRGLYTSAAGMVASLRKNDTISNNLANINTTGYKKQMVVEKSFPNQVLCKIDQNSTEIGSVGGGVAIDEIVTDQQQGNFEETGSTFDWAIKGGGFFTIQTSQGIRYTRNGNFTVNNQGQVVTQNGNLVRGENGILQIPAYAEEIVLNGNDLVVDGRIIDRVQIKSFANESGLIKEGDALFKISSQVGNIFAANGEILQGKLEKSNVNPIAEMTKMIANNRIYQADQKTIDAQNETLGKVVNEVGKV